MEKQREKSEGFIYTIEEEIDILNGLGMRKNWKKKANEIEGFRDKTGNLQHES